MVPSNLGGEKKISGPFVHFQDLCGAQRSANDVSNFFSREYTCKSCFPQITRSTQIGFKSSIFRPCDLEIWWKTPKNNKARLLYHTQALICVSFQIHQEIQTEDTVRKRPIWVKIEDSFSRMTFEFDVWPWKTIGHLFYSTSSFVHHFVAMGEFKLELQSGNAQLSAIWRFLESCDLETWCMTLKNNRAPLLCYFKLCA